MNPILDTLGHLRGSRPVVRLTQIVIPVCLVSSGGRVSHHRVNQQGRHAAAVAQLSAAAAAGNVGGYVLRRIAVLYEYQPTRKAEHAETFLRGFSGWLHADGYQGYHKLPDNIRVVDCWAHARRKFDEALSALPQEKREGSPAAAGEWYAQSF